MGHTLSVLQSSPFQGPDSDPVQFLTICILMLPDKGLRIALHERLLTLKRQLEEGVIAHKVGATSTDGLGDEDAPRPPVARQFNLVSERQTRISKLQCSI